MQRYSVVLLALGCSLLLLSCGDTVTATGQVIVEFNETVDFTQFETFSVLTRDVVPEAPEPGEDEQLFNDLVNELIIEAMTSEPVCLQYIPTDEVTEGNQPDLWAGNGLARTTEDGVVWQCVGGWWWGYWGWYWDPCAWLAPVPVEFDIGNLLVPVGPPPPDGEDPRPVFAGLAQSVVGTGPDVRTKAQEAVRSIFEQWPDRRTCPQ
jgi:hypothetical protein